MWVVLAFCGVPRAEKKTFAEDCRKEVPQNLRLLSAMSERGPDFRWPNIPALTWRVWGKTKRVSRPALIPVPCRASSRQFGFLACRLVVQLVTRSCSRLHLCPIKTENAINSVASEQDSGRISGTTSLLSECDVVLRAILSLDEY